MATHDVYRPNVDYTLADQVTSPIDGKTAFVPSFKAAGGTTGGAATARVVTGTTGVIKASAGQLYSLSAYNSNAGVRYLQLYNKATAPTLSTDTPVMTFPLLATGITHVPLPSVGAAFSTGISWAYTTDDIAIPTTAGTSTELHFTAGYV